MTTELQSSALQASPLGTHLLGAAAFAPSFIRVAVRPLMVLVVLFGLVITGRALYVLPWVAAFAVTILCARAYDRLLGCSSRFVNVVCYAFLFISIVGMVQVSDNLRDFGTEFGFANDDTEFFTRTVDLVQQHIVRPETSLYEVLLAVWGYLPILASGRFPNLLTVLPINWGLSAAVVGLCDVLCMKVLGWKPPVHVLGATLLLNYVFMDSLVRLYRDSLMLIFLLLALISVAESRYARSLIFAVPMAILRGANAFLFLPTLFARACLGKLRPLSFYLILLAVGLTAYVSFETILPYAFRYATQASKIGDDDLPLSWSLAEYVDFRSNMVASQTTAGSTLQKTLSNQSSVGMAIRPVLYIFFPVRFWPIDMPGYSASPRAVTSNLDHGTFLMNGFVWASVVVWPMVAPLALIGFCNLLRGTAMQRALCIYYVIALLTVSLISMQNRHALCFIVLHPLLATAGWAAVRKSRTARILALSIGVIVAAAIAGYNLSGGRVF